MAIIPAMPSFTANQPIKCADLNQLRDGVNFALQPPNCVARQAISGTSVPSNQWTPITFDTVEIDTDAGMQNNDAVYTCQTAGWYTVSVNLAWPWQNPSTGNRGVRLALNTVPQPGAVLEPAASSIVTGVMLTRAIYLKVGDQLRVEGWQDTGSNVTTVLNYQAAQQRSETSFLSITFVTAGSAPGNYAPPPPPTNVNGTPIFGTETAGSPIFGVGASDLGVPYSRAPYNGDQTSTGLVFGDSFTGSSEGAGTFIHSPVLLYSNTLPDQTITFNGCYGHGTPRVCDPIVPVVSGEVTKIVNDAWMGPTGSRYPKRTFVHYVCVNTWTPGSGSDGTNYSAICYSDNDGGTWTDKAITWPGDTQGTAQSNNMVMSIVDDSANSGYFYVFRKRWGRSNSGGPRLTRYSDILNSSTAQNWYYASGSWQWGTAQDSTPLFSSESNWGEMSVRVIAGTWVMSYFVANSPFYIATRTAPGPNQVWSNAKTQITGTSYPQLYGGYIHPMSKSLSDVTIIVSQWNTSTNDPYRAMQFQVSV